MNEILCFINWKWLRWFNFANFDVYKEKNSRYRKQACVVWKWVRTIVWLLLLLAKLLILKTTNFYYLEESTVELCHFALSEVNTRKELNKCDIWQNIQLYTDRKCAIEGLLTLPTKRCVTRIQFKMSDNEPLQFLWNLDSFEMDKFLCTSNIVWLMNNKSNLS